MRPQPRPLSGLRARLLLLVVGAGLIPVIGLIYFTWAERAAATQRVEETAQRVVIDLADDFSQSLSQARFMLVSLERTAQALRGEPPNCNEVFASIKAKYEQLAPTFTNIGAISPLGKIYCAVNIIGGPVDVADETYYRRALDTRNFTVGDYQLEAATDRMLLPVSYPIQGYTAQPRAVLFAYLNLDWLDLVYAKAQVPTDSEFMLVTHDHNVLVRYPRTVAATEVPWEDLVLQAGLVQKTHGRLYATAPLQSDPASGYWALMSIPTATVYADADRAMGVNVTLLAFVLLVMLVAAGRGAEVFVLRDVRAVLRVTEQVGRGELGARTGVEPGTQELNQLARTFDEMSVALEQRERERAAAEAETRQLLAETQRRASELAALYEITHDIATQQNLPGLLQRIVERAAHLMAGFSGLLFLYNEACGDLELTVAYGTTMTPGMRIALGEAIVGAVAQSQQARIVSAADIPMHPATVNTRLSSIALVPLLYSGRLIGVLGVGAEATQQAYTEANVRLLSLVAGHIASAVYNAHLLAAETLARQTAETLQAANMALTRLLNLDVVLETLLDYLGRLVPYDTANIMLLETQTRLNIRAMRGYEQWASAPPSRDALFEVEHLPLDQRVLTEQISLLVDDTLTEPDWQDLSGGRHVRNWLGVPLVAGGRTLGLFSLDKSQPHFFTSTHQHLAEAMAAQAAIAIQNARLYEEVRSGEARLRQLTQQIVTTQEEERQRVSRELHDEAGQALVGLKLQLDAMRDNLPSEMTPFAVHIESTERQIESAMKRIRALARNLRPQALETVGLHRLLEDMCFDYVERTHLNIDYQGVELPGFSLDASIGLYRVAQEALTNVAKHAHAQAVRVELGRENGEVYLLVEDDGQGFNWLTAQQFPTFRGIGLIGMRERVELLRGHFDVVSAPGRGTLLSVRVPWQ